MESEELDVPRVPKLWKERRPEDLHTDSATASEDWPFLFFLFFFFSVLGVELGISCLLDRHYTT
jgi:hypothetical protein